MKDLRLVAQHVAALLFALTLTACLGDSAEDGANSTGISLTITSPSNASAIDTTDAIVNLSGVASSNNGISEVSWASDRGRQGIATGTESWQTGNIQLDLGKNNITVTAKSGDGATVSRSIIINRESGFPGAVTLSWTAPTTRTDGTPLSNLGGFKIYYGRMSGIYDFVIDITNPSISSYVVENLASGSWYFVLTAYDSVGLESDRSNEVIRQIS